MINLTPGALRRPVTVVVLIFGLALGAVLALREMPRDILPNLGVPILYVAQPYGGMSPEQMEGYLTYYYEYHFLYISGIEHVESRNIQGTALIKLQFHPGTDMSQALAETINYANRARAFMPPGTVPPFVMRFDAGSVPVGNLVFSSNSRTVGELQDFALNRVRPLFATLPGVSAPPPFGASQRTIVVRVDPERLRAYQLSMDEIVKAISDANRIGSAGSAPIGGKLPMVPVNSIVRNVRELEDVPIRTGVYPAVFVRDIGTVEDSTDLATGFALVQGRRTVFIPVTKRASASTLSVVDEVRKSIPRFQDVLPSDVKVSYEFDQSPYVRRSIRSLEIEGVMGAVLTGLMVLLFLRDFRSALVVILNIPLALIAAVLALWLCRQTINVMTLGGLALAVGILVDEATVAMENIHTHLTQGQSIARAALDSSAETAVPRLLAMLAVLAVFIPSFFMVGAAKALFVPMTLAVGFAMIGSYLLSSTFVPIASAWLLAHHPSDRHSKPSRWKMHYGSVVQGVLRWRWIAAVVYLAACGVIIWLAGRNLGLEIFPTVTGGQLQVRLRAPSGTAIEQTENAATNVLQMIAARAGASNVDMSIGFVGVQPPTYPINTIYLWTSGSEEAVLQVQLKPSAKISVPLLEEQLRRQLAAEMPLIRVSFEPSDLVSRALSFGSPTPIEIAVSGPNLTANRAYAEKIFSKLQPLGALRDLQYGQSFDYPTVEVQLDRERAGLLGVTASRLVDAITSATYSSRYSVPNYWADPKSGIAFQVQVEIPPARMNSIEEIKNIPVKTGAGASLLLRTIADITNGIAPSELDRYNMQRMVTLSANIAGEDLGRVASRLRQTLGQVGAPPAGVQVHLRGQIVPMEQMLSGLETGLLLAIAVIFLLLAAYFQSIRLALAVILAAPAVLAGVTLALWATHTTVNVQSFMGAIMAVGVSMANAILLLTFAERNRAGGMDPQQAAVEAGQSRIRAILMTSCAMMAGMLPMAFGFGEAGEQSAPLGRAVLGGLAASTIATLLVLPALYSVLEGKGQRVSASLHPDDIEDSRSGSSSAPQFSS